MSALTIQVESKGYNCGYSAWIGVNGEDVGKNRYGRGINVATLDNNWGSLLEFRNFDTHGNERAATELAEFISALAPGTIVVMAVQDEATYKLHERSRQACQSVGSALIYQLDYGDLWAIIGQKGAAPGSVKEKRDNNLVSIEHTISLRDRESIRSLITTKLAAFVTDKSSASISKSAREYPSYRNSKMGINNIPYWRASEYRR